MKKPRQVLSIHLLGVSALWYIALFSFVIFVICAIYIQPLHQTRNDEFILGITIHREKDAPLSIKDQFNFLDQVQKLQEDMRLWLVEANKKVPSAHVTSRNYLHLGKNFDGVMKNPKLLNELYGRIKPNVKIIRAPVTHRR